MLIGIISDSHDNLPAMAKAVSLFNEKGVTTVLHAGDLISPFTEKEMRMLKMQYHVVFGNNDGEKLGLKSVYGERIQRPPLHLTLDQRKVLLLHEPDNLQAVADSGHYDLIIYGHTHEIDLRREKSIILNPGECGGWVTGKCSVALWNTSTDKIDIIEL